MIDTVILGLVVIGVTVVTAWGTVRARQAQARWTQLAASLEAKMNVVSTYGTTRVYGVAGMYAQRRWQLLAKGSHGFLQVQCAGVNKSLYLDHQTEKQRQWTGRGRRDRTGKRVPIYGDMVLRARPEALVDAVMTDEIVWDALRTRVVPYLLNGATRPIELRRYWLNSYLTASPFYWADHSADLYHLIGALCALAARIEALEIAVSTAQDVALQEDAVEEQEPEISGMQEIEVQDNTGDTTTEG